jgi:hypothetical protein
MPRDASLPPIAEARPPLPPAPEPAPVPWEHHLEVGGGLAITALPAHLDGAGNPTPVRIQPGAGFHIDLSWQVFRYLRFSMFMVEHFHTLDLPAGPERSLGVAGRIPSVSMHGYTFGVRAAPTLPLGKRVRLWLSVGWDFGYLGYPELVVTGVTPPNCAPAMMNCTPTIRGRTATMFEVPLGLGAAVEIIPRWLSLHLEVTGAFVPSQSGEALSPGQYIDVNGIQRSVGPMPKLDASFVQTLGLSVHL